MTGDYQVGYGRPPKETRFRPGCSGNPRGRPKGALGLKGTLRKVLLGKVTVREGEVTRRVTRLEAVLLSLVAKASKGDARALATILELAQMIETEPEAEAEAEDWAAPAGAKQELADRLERIAARLQAAREDEAAREADKEAGQGVPDPSAATVEAKGALDRGDPGTIPVDPGWIPVDPGSSPGRDGRGRDD